MSVVLEQIGKTEVFLNDAGSICVKQTTWPEDPVYVVLPIMYIDAIVAALLAAKEEAKCPQAVGDDQA